MRMGIAALLVLIGSTLLLAVLLDSLVQPRSQFVSSPFAIPILIAAYRMRPRGVALTALVVTVVAVSAAYVDRAPLVPAAFNLFSLLIIGAISTLLGLERMRSAQRARDVQTLNDELRAINQGLVISNVRVRQLEEQYEAAHREVTAILESITDAFCALDSEWRFTYVNNEAARLLQRVFRRAPASLIGKSFWDEFPEARGSEFERNLRRAVAERRPVTLEEFYPPTATWLEVRAYPSSTGLSLYVRDITERKRAEEERERLLREVDVERARFQTILASMANAVIYVERRTGHLLANAAAARLFGHAFDPSLGQAQYLRQLAHPDGRPLAMDEVPSRHALAGHTMPHVELLVVQPDGRRVPVLESAAPVYGPDETVLGAIIVFQDISALKDLERLREEWTSVIAHDLRQPVTLILGYAGILEKAIRPPGASDERRAIEHILTAARSLTKMISDLLDVSRIEARRLTLQRQSVDLVVLAQDVVERTAAMTAGHAVRIEVAGQVPRVDVDPSRIEQVLTNLLSNAAKYSFPGSDIVIGIRRRNQQVELSVTNQGPGIAANEIPRLFTRFYRTREAQAGRTSGLGLGLYIAKGLVEAHGGDIWVESTPGQTTTFHVDLPAGTTAR